MPADPIRHHRHSLRLPGYDYRQPGFYFVTICTRNHDCVLGSIVGDKMYLNDIDAMMNFTNYSGHPLELIRKPC
jgi:putative transposase